MWPHWFQGATSSGGSSTGSNDKFHWLSAPGPENKAPSGPRSSQSVVVPVVVLLRIVVRSCLVAWAAVSLACPIVVPPVVVCSVVPSCRLAGCLFHLALAARAQVASASSAPTVLLAHRKCSNLICALLGPFPRCRAPEGHGFHSLTRDTLPLRWLTCVFSRQAPAPPYCSCGRVPAVHP